MNLPKRIEIAILGGLLNSDTYARYVTPYIKPDYFSEKPEQAIFSAFQQSFNKYNKVPTMTMVSLDVNSLTGFPDAVISESHELLSELHKVVVTDEKWLIEKTEKWCRDRALFLAIMESLEIIEGNHPSMKKDSLPTLFSNALQINFDTKIGHDFIEDAEARFDLRHKFEEKIPFDLECLNTITNGGLMPKTLSIIMAPTGVGKTLVNCHFAASYLLKGYNVLYITLEMAEERIAERIDANLLNVPLQDLKKMNKGIYLEKINALRRGKIIIKEYPTAQAHAGHFRALIEELKVKKDFRPQIVIVDYMNIAASQRLKMGTGVNTYSYVKSIAEELRGLAVEYDVALITSTQTNRGGMNNSDVDLGDTSDSVGGPMTADLLLVVMTNEELEKANQLLFKQLKNRYSDVSVMRRFIVGVDKSRMKLFDVDAPLFDTPKADKDSPANRDDVPLFDRSTDRSRHSGFVFD